MKIPKSAGKQAGFTLIELLIVVIILGILAAAVVPLFSDKSTQARIATLKSDLSNMRSQFGLYKVEHGMPPGVFALNTEGTITFPYVLQDGTLTSAPQLYQPAVFRSDPLNASLAINLIHEASTATSSLLAANLFDQLTLATNKSGNRAPLVGQLLYGPYLQKFPYNPFAPTPTGNRIRILHPFGGVNIPATDTAVGFHYNPYTTQIIATGAVPEMPPEEVEVGNVTLQDL